MNETGIWISTIEQWILWQNLIASFVRKEDNGESLSYYLILHYYLETYDTFATSEFQINNLVMKLEDIAAEIEYRKTSRQKETATRR